MPIAKKKKREREIMRKRDKENAYAEGCGGSGGGEPLEEARAGCGGRGGGIPCGVGCA
jgi:hypothetical protein